MGGEGTPKDIGVKFGKAEKAGAEAEPNDVGDAASRAVDEGDGMGLTRAFLVGEPAKEANASVH